MTDVEKGFRFTDLPAYAAININHKEERNYSPRDIYEMSQAFRNIYEKSKALSQKISVPSGNAIPIKEIPLIHAIPSALAVQLALSNELLLKAVLLGSTGKSATGHSLKELLSKLDLRYKKYIKNHLIKNDLKPNTWSKVIKDSDLIFATARYGYEKRSYRVDFITLQLINEALDDIYHSMLPNWTIIKDIAESTRIKRRDLIQEQVDMIFDEEYQAQLKRDLEEFDKEWRLSNSG